MPGSITLPQVVLELEEEDRQRYEALKPPTSIVVRYGYMKLVAELPYDGDAKPGCGSKLVVRTRRGTELAEMLTTTCANSGCGKSVSRKQMLEYIENSGGRDYPFTDQGRVLRVASVEDLAQQAALDAGKPATVKLAKSLIAELGLAMKLVDVEMLLGGERIMFHYTAEAWIDFRELVRRLAAELHTRIEMHQVNARDEARITADYEKCGQHCCCKQFLKVLKPVSMRSAKVQKATLDPTKISGRCGRLMCCLRYEDETYESLRKKLPHRNTRVMTDEGPGTVVDTQILTQLVLVKLDRAAAAAAFAVESIEVMQDQSRPAVEEPRAERPRPPRRERQGGGDPRAPRPREPRRPRPGAPLGPDDVEAREDAALEPADEDAAAEASPAAPPSDTAEIAGLEGVQGLSVIDGGASSTGAADAGETEDAVSINETADAADEGADAVESLSEGGEEAPGATGPAGPGTAGVPQTPGPAGAGKRRRRRRRRRRGGAGGGAQAS